METLVKVVLWSEEILVVISSQRVVRTGLRLIVIETSAAMLDWKSSDMMTEMAYVRHDKECCGGSNVVLVMKVANWVFVMRCCSHARLVKRQWQGC